MAVSDGRQPNMVANPARHLIFIEDVELCYNYKTQQWSRIPAYDSLGMFSVNDSNVTIGLIRYSSGAVTLQTQRTDLGEIQTATITTGETDLLEGGRALIDGIRPLVNGGTVTSRVGVRDSISDSVTWCTGTSVNSRTGMIHFRNASSPPEGRYQRAEFTITGNFTTAMGADIDAKPAGQV